MLTMLSLLLTHIGASIMTKDAEIMELDTMVASTTAGTTIAATGEAMEAVDGVVTQLADMELV
jgi:hypothetical protein